MTAPHEPTEAQKAEVRALASMGIPHDQIATYIGIDKKTLYKYYREILDKAKIQANMKMAQCLFQQAQNGSTPAAIFWLKIQAGWQENTKVDVTTNGESLNKKGIDTSKLTDDQLRAFDALISQASEAGAIEKESH